MDCTLKVTAGPENGQEFTCAGPDTYIGRSQRCGVRLSAATVSFEHAVVHRTGDEFFLENLSANGTYLNNQRMASRTRLKARDQIRLGDQTVLRVENVPAVAGGGSASRRGLLVLLLILMVFGGTGFLFIYNGSEPEPLNWQHAYATLQGVVDQEAAAGRMQAELPAHFREAWRLEVAHDRPNASKTWLGVEVAIADDEVRTGTTGISGANRSALSRLLKNDKNDKPLTEEELQAALDQFVQEMVRRK